MQHTEKIILDLTHYSSLQKIACPISSHVFVHFFSTNFFFCSFKTTSATFIKGKVIKMLFAISKWHVQKKIESTEDADQTWYDVIYFLKCTSPPSSPSRLYMMYLKVWTSFSKRIVPVEWELADFIASSVSCKRCRFPANTKNSYESLFR